MLTLRAYQTGDAQTIASWIRDKTVFTWWSAGKLGAFPLGADTLAAAYKAALDAGDAFPRVLEEDGKPCGQLMMRRADAETMHFGYIVVDPDARGKGLGSAMLAMAMEFAFHIKGAKRVTLHVFAENAPAIRCYERLGFHRIAAFSMEIDGRQMRLYTYEKRAGMA